MRRFTLALCLALLMTLSACGQSAVDRGMSSGSTVPAVSAPEGSKAVASNDKPTVPDDIAEGTEYQYDFQFSQRYDERMTEDFSLTVPGAEKTLFLFEKYKNEDAVSVQRMDGEGMEPHAYKKYCFAAEQGEVIVVTDYYEPDNVEYISYIWTTVEGTKTGRNVAIGTTEKELLDAYPTDLYYLSEGQTEPSFFAKNENGALSLTFDCAYAWQPYTRESNDIRDITFYLKDGKVAGIEMLEPYELRYVYGYDREAGLNYAQEQRS